MNQNALVMFLAFVDRLLDVEYTSGEQKNNFTGGFNCRNKLFAVIDGRYDRADLDLTEKINVQTNRLHTDYKKTVPMLFCENNLMLMIRCHILLYQQE